MGIDNSFVRRDRAEAGGKVCSSYILEDEAKECGKALKDEPVSADLYLKNEALIAFIRGETGVAQVRDLAGAIHDRLTRLGGKLSGLSEVLYGGDNPVGMITARLQSEIARLTAEKERGDVMSESVGDNVGGVGKNGRSGGDRGNGSGKSERLMPGTVVDGVVVKLFSGGLKVTIPGGGKSVAVHCGRTGGFRPGQTVTVRMTRRMDDFKNPVAELVS